ncbi:predicted RND superfamily drug exporter [Brachybacterium faecium DSM 4810]|uniref:Predicted RND superfamily drug exporter n=1 Tax=Brachybacterium faecium (strain ATCC 43885 / DSM 4810 / JCM 11609 / LMG 19847 / NBRC 14762 / NCIMB 9860 / 6-10) TaxID=446465 RepID=C7MCU3_BRAFD|nr:MMPL family transporter [Brachybacterium faecium]ACU85400.1 predicted RND superfamily drug exporter [Brachybacterium faecium DSM 4810]
MSSSLYRLGRLMASLRWKVVGAWVALLVIVGGLAVGLGGTFSTDIEIPGTEGQRGIDTLAHRFPEMGGTSGQVVLRAQDGTTVDDHQDEIDALMDEIAEIDGVAAAPSPFDEVSPGTRNDDDTALIAQFQMDGQTGEFPAESVDEITELVDGADTAALDASIGGQVLQSAEIPFGAGEVIGVIVALIILAIVFRSLVPAIIPIVTAVVGVGVSMMALVALSAGLEIPSVTTALGAMLGLAVGIDYALFILSRHRDQLSHGDDVHESIGTSLATSGSAVIFAGMTVIVALVGLFITGIPFLTVMGVAAAATVALSVIVALTMLPAIMGILGERLRPRRTRRLMAENGGALPAADPQARPRRSLGRTWVRLVTKVPALTILVVIVGVGALAIPIKDLELALPDLGTEPTGTAARDTYDLVAEEFGPGYNGPLLVTADIINSTDPLGVVDELESDIASLDHVKEVQLATPNQGADMAVVAVIPEGGPTEQSTKDLVLALRGSAESWEEDLSISDVTVTGSTAVGIDVTDKLSDALLPFALFVVGLSLILLALVFRSVWVPLKASVGYLFSVLAAFGATSMVFEYGWFNGPLFVDVNGPVVSFMPIMVMGVLFGLAMDYEVFLVSRMREEFVHTGDARGAIERGFTANAPVVTAAALIMVAVFAGFVTSGWFMLQPIAVALAVGVLVDAFVVRMTFVPAVLALLGRHAWWLPGWLSRALPTVDVEGEGLAAVLEHRRWTEAHGRHSLRLEETVAPLLGEPGTLGPLTGSVVPGTLLVVRAPDDAARETFLALCAGRLTPRSGVLAVHDRLAPDDLGAIQARSHWIGTGARVSRRLAEIGGHGLGTSVIVIEQIEDLAHAATGDDMLVERLDALLAKGATLVVGSRSAVPIDAERHLASTLRDPRRLLALSVQRSTAPALEGARA